MCKSDVIPLPFKYFNVVIPTYYNVSIIFPKEPSDELRFIAKKSATVSVQYECAKIHCNLHVKAKYTMLLCNDSKYYMISETYNDLIAKSIINDRVKIAMPIKGVSCLLEIHAPHSNRSYQKIINPI